MPNDTRVEVRLPSSVLEEIHRVKGDAPLSVWIRRALMERLDREAKR